MGWGGAGNTSIKGLQQNFPRLHNCLVLLASYLNDNVGTLGSFNASDYFVHYKVFGFSWVVDYFRTQKCQLFLLLEVKGIESRRFFFLFFVYNNLGPRYFKKAQFHLYSIVKSKPIYATQVHRRQSMYTQVYFDDVQCWSHKNWIFIIALCCTKRKNCRTVHFCSKAPA